jgi:hypothetical protein
VARSILAALEGRLPQPGGARVTLAHPALRLAVPQVIGAQGEGAAHSRLQIRLDRPAKGRLQLADGGRILASARLDSLPERRLSLPLPADPGQGPLTLTIKEG